MPSRHDNDHIGRRRCSIAKESKLGAHTGLSRVFNLEDDVRDRLDSTSEDETHIVGRESSGAVLLAHTAWEEVCEDGIPSLASGKFTGKTKLFAYNIVSQELSLVYAMDGPYYVISASTNNSTDVELRSVVALVYFPQTLEEPGFVPMTHWSRSDIETEARVIDLLPNRREHLIFSRRSSTFQRIIVFKQTESKPKSRQAFLLILPRVISLHLLDKDKKSAGRKSTMHTTISQSCVWYDWNPDIEELTILQVPKRLIEHYDKTLSTDSKYVKLQVCCRNWRFSDPRKPIQLNGSKDKDIIFSIDYPTNSFAEMSQERFKCLVLPQSMRWREGFWPAVVHMVLLRQRLNRTVLCQQVFDEDCAPCVIVSMFIIHQGIHAQFMVDCASASVERWKLSADASTPDTGGRKSSDSACSSHGIGNPLGVKIPFCFFGVSADSVVLWSPEHMFGLLPLGPLHEAVDGIVITSLSHPGFVPSARKSNYASRRRSRSSKSASIDINQVEGGSTSQMPMLSTSTSNMSRIPSQDSLSQVMASSVGSGQQRQLSNSGPGMPVSPTSPTCADTPHSRVTLHQSAVCERSVVEAFDVMPSASSNIMVPDLQGHCFLQGVHGDAVAYSLNTRAIAALGQQDKSMASITAFVLAVHCLDTRHAENILIEHLRKCSFDVTPDLVKEYLVCFAFNIAIQSGIDPSSLQLLPCTTIPRLEDAVRVISTPMVPSEHPEERPCKLSNQVLSFEWFLASNDGNSAVNAGMGSSTPSKCKSQSSSSALRSFFVASSVESGTSTVSGCIELGEEGSNYVCRKAVESISDAMREANPKLKKNQAQEWAQIFVDAQVSEAQRVFKLLISNAKSRSDAFVALESLHVAVHELGILHPRGFSDHFAAIGLASLPRHVFLQYVDRNVISLSYRFVRKAIAALGSSYDDSSFKLDLLARLPGMHTNQSLSLLQAHPEFSRLIVENFLSGMSHFVPETARTTFEDIKNPAEQSPSYLPAYITCKSICKQAREQLNLPQVNDPSLNVKDLPLEIQFIIKNMAVMWQSGEGHSA